ncbi:MAG TPA: hypothetical protein VKT17_06625 [Acidobacteriota bacterium]|nr:hypothetical protein [Acidobacteriota bacterium]
MSRLRLAVLLTAFVPVLAASAPAQGLSFSAGAGRLFPSAGQYREIYGPGLSLGGDLWLTLKSHFGFAAGFGLLTDKGTAVRVGADTAEYPLSFRRTSFPVVVFYELDAGPAVFRLGTGAGIHSYRETWRTVALSYAGHRISPRIVMTASLGIIDRISVFFQASYDSIRAGADSALGQTVPLGGYQLLGGLAFRIF